MKTHYSGLKIVALACVSGFLLFTDSAAALNIPDTPFSFQPSQITAEADPITAFAVSTDGRRMVFVSKRDRFTDLWMRDNLPDSPTVLTRLTQDPAMESDPAISDDGRFIAYTSTDQDAKGDIFLIDLSRKNQKPWRLTGKETEDGGPCFAPGGVLFFHQKAPESLTRDIVFIKADPRQFAPGDFPKTRQLSTDGDAAFPAVSPDGKRVAFVSNRHQDGFDLYVTTLDTKIVKRLTDGPAIDLFPRWSADGIHLLFSRREWDTNRDGMLNTSDNAVLHRISEKDQTPHPLTTARISSTRPAPSQDAIYFLSDQKGMDNCWRIPLNGQIPHLENPSAQFTLAERIAGDNADDPYLILLAYSKVIERYPDHADIAARSLYAMGHVFNQLKWPRQADQAFEKILNRYPHQDPEYTFAAVQKTILKVNSALEATRNPDARRQMVGSGIQDIEAAVFEKESDIQYVAQIQKALLLTRIEGPSSDLLAAIRILDAVLSAPDVRPERAAEAMLIKGDIYRKVGSFDAVYPIYLSVVLNYPHLPVWSDLALERMLDLVLTRKEGVSLEDRIQLLTELAVKYKNEAPQLSMEALNRIGDMQYAAGEVSKAKIAFRQVIEQFPVRASQTAAARFALAEILYKEQRYRDAMVLYENEIRLREKEDRIRRLAREGFIQKSLEGADYYFDLGEIDAARSLFKEVINFNEGTVEGHRGYIKCAAVQNDIPSVLKDYRDKTVKNRSNSVYVYATGLCLTYRNDKKSLMEARELLDQAILLNGQISHFHRTLGYVQEILETVHGQRGGLDAALESYQKAYFLTDPEMEPKNHAELSLNLGNIYFLLGQHAKAFHYYFQRLSSNMPISNLTAAVLFYKRLGISAFQINRMDQSVAAFNEALHRIDAGIDTQDPDVFLNRNHRYVMDRIVTPVLQFNSRRAEAQRLAQAQSNASHSLSEAQSMKKPPPGPAWHAYQKKILAQISLQESLNQQALQLVKNSMKSGAFNREQSHAFQRNLSLMISKAEAAASQPERLIEMKVEMLDRLGLAFQESGEFRRAVQSFEQAYSINEDLGNRKNLARNLRSVAFNRYLQAEIETGRTRIQELQRASKEFSRVIELVDQFGIPATPVDPDDALIRVDVQTALDETGATKSGRGFSKIQEKRLAETFIGRISIELDELEAASVVLDNQRAFYADTDSLPESDVYGVSLLFHRKGHLAAATGKWQSAFEDFERSALLSLRSQNLVASILNATNMAKVLTLFPPETFGRKKMLMVLEKIDRQAQNLSSSDFPGASPKLLAAYHNAMGVYFSSIQPSRNPDLQETVSASRLMQKAILHFNKGILAIEPQDRLSSNRELSALSAALHLNLGRALFSLSEDATARSHFEKAMLISEKTLLPDIQWRALVALGRHLESIEILNALTVLRAGCTKGEILDSFLLPIQRLTESGQVEAAFNLLEKIAEMERFNRLAPLFFNLTESEKKLFSEAISILDRIDNIEETFKTAQGLFKKDLKEELSLENSRLSSLFGKDYQNLPEFIRLIPNHSTKMAAIRLTGLAVLAEKTADAAIRDASGANLREQYAAIIKRYGSLLKETKTQEAPDSISGSLSLFGPDIFKAIDVMKTLPDKSRVLRMYQSTRHPGQNLGDVVLFTLTSGGISGSVHASLDVAMQNAQSPLYRSNYLIVDHPDDILTPSNTLSDVHSIMFSAAHFIRSFRQKTPFKRTLLRIPSPDIKNRKTPHNPPNPLEEIYNAPPSGFHVLVVSHPVYTAYRVPMRSGMAGSAFFAMDMENGRRVSLLPLLSLIGNTSCAILEDISAEDVYRIGHLFSIYGCPTLVLPLVSHPGSRFVESFLSAFETQTAFESMKSAQPSALNGEKWALIGHPGMTQEESRAFASASFESYLTRAKRTFDEKRFTEALILFENTINIASESPSFKPYLPYLFIYARESAYLSRQFEKALAYAGRAADAFHKEKPDTQAHADTLLRLGLLQAQMEDFVKAAGNMKQALDIYQSLEMTPQQVEILTQMGRVAEQATDYGRALSYLESSVSLGKDSDPRWVLADRYRSIGRIYDLRLSQYASALTHYEIAAKLYDQGQQSAQSQAGNAQALLDMGRCYQLMGNLVESDQYLEKAFNRIASLPGQDALLSKIYIEQANNAWYRARYEEAFRLQRKAWNIAQEKELWPLQVISLNTSGLLWWTLGDNKKALAELSQALDIAKRFPDREDEVASTLNNIGMIYRETGQYEAALNSFEAARSIDQRLKSRWALAYDYRHIGVTLLKMGKIDRAIPLLSAALGEARAVGNRIHEAKALLDSADAHWVIQKAPEAESLYREALSLSKALSIQEIQWRALYGLARTQEKTHPDEAMDFLQEAIEIIESVRSNIRISQLKDGFLSNKLMVYESLCRLLADAERPLEAFEIAERSRSRNFIDLLGSQSLSLDPAIDARLFNSYRTLQERIETLKQQSTQEADPDRKKLLLASLERNTSELGAVMLEIQAANPRLAALVSVEPIRANLLQKQIEPGVALLSYYLLADEIFCWRILPDSIRLFRQVADRNLLSETLLDYRRRIQNLEPVDKASSDLFDLLIRPVIHDLPGVTKVGIIPHGPLHYLSFATLLDENSFLIDRFSLFYLPSASALKYTIEKRLKEKNLNVLAVGNPDLGNIALNLPFAEHEVRSIRWNFPKITILTQEKATEKWVVDNIERFGIIHLASHGEFDAINPLLSAIKLAKEEDSDGNLEAGEIFGLTLNADLVVLSACQTGLGKIEAGDDVIGLTRAFLYAGTHALISSLWRVSDVSTAILVKEFYRRYVDQDKADSLRRAVLHVKNRYPHPGYWGAFTLVGDYF